MFASLVHFWVCVCVCVVGAAVREITTLQFHSEETRDWAQTQSTEAVMREFAEAAGETTTTTKSVQSLGDCDACPFDELDETAA